MKKAVKHTNPTTITVTEIPSSRLSDHDSSRENPSEFSKAAQEIKMRKAEEKRMRRGSKMQENSYMQGMS